jgi:hypothetical protein
MISKKLSLSALLLIGLTPSYQTFSAISDAAAVECYKGKDAEWKYIEFIFIEQPKNQLNSFIQKARAGLLAIVTTAILSTQFNTVKSYTFDAAQIKPDLPTFSAGVLGLIGFETLTNYIDASIKHDALVKFLKNWDFHKQNVPNSLIPAFDELAAALNRSNTKTFTTEQVTTIFEIIQHLIEHEFSKRYEKDKKKDVDMIGVFKTITEITKNVAPKASGSKE